MESFKVLILLVIIVIISLSGCDCTNLGKNNCLASRLEHVPCQYRLPQITRQPGKNELGDYYTAFSNGRCDILRKKHRVESVPRLSLSGSLTFYLYSPGKRYIVSRNYPNRKLVYYNVECPNNHYIYFELFDMNLENTKCYDSSVGRSKCVDYIQVKTPQGHTIADNCGADKSNLNGAILPFNSIKVIFRTSSRSTYSGFFAIAQCFSPYQPSSLHCLAPKPGNNNNNMCQGSNYEKIEIPYGHELTLQDGTAYSKLDIRDRMTNSVIKRFTKQSFRTLDFRRMDGSIQKFEKTIRNPLDKYTLNLEERLRRQHEFYSSQFIPSIPRLLKGPGILYVPKNSNGRACFQNYLVDVSKYVPTQSEREMIRQFSKAGNKLIDRVKAPVDDLETDEVDLEPDEVLPFIDVDRIPTDRHDRILPDWRTRLALQKRSLQPIQKISKIDQSTLLSAVKNNGACNPILRGSASILSKTLQTENPSQFKTLQERALQLDNRLLQNNRLS